MELKPHHVSCLILIAEGKNTRQISERMLICGRTIRRYYVILLKAGLVQRLIGEWGEVLGYRVTPEGREYLQKARMR